MIKSQKEFHYLEAIDTILEFIINDISKKYPSI